ncbi:MAG: hypothetical protein ACJ75G_11225 [Gaiellaceae bacterium]
MRICWAGATTILLLLAACGGGGNGVSKDEYRSELAKISKQAGTAHAQLERDGPTATTVAQLQAALRRFAGAEDRIGDELSKLKVPNDAKAANAELARGQHDDADEIRALLPKLSKYKSVQDAFTSLQRLGGSKGGREGDEALTKLRELGYTQGS